MCTRDVYVKIVSLCIILCNFVLQSRKEQLGSSIVTILEHMSRVSILMLSNLCLLFVTSEVGCHDEVCRVILMLLLSGCRVC